MATNRKKDSSLGLKLIGSVINLGVLVLYSLSNLKTVLSSFNDVMLINYNNNFTKDNVTEAMNTVNKYAIRETAILLGVVVFFELVNYLIYLKKAKNLLLGMIFLNFIAFIVLGVMLGFGYPQLYIVLLPIVTGLINYALLLNEDK